MRTAPLGPLAAAALACLTALVAGCPDAPTPGPDVDTPLDVDDADTATSDDDSDIHVTVPDACDSVAECEADATLSACQNVACVEHRCVVSDLAAGTPCDDDSPCTSTDQCVDGACVGTDACDDDNACTTDGCDPLGGCVHTFNQRPCDDGSVCTSGDHCAQGACGGDPLDCDDHNACTTDACDAVLGCVSEDRTGACDDGNACTTGDSCQAGACVPGAATVCGDPDNSCIAASCDPVEGCEVEVLSGPCDDDNACTADDACVEGVCGGQTVVCNDANPCTDDYCDQAAGCITVDNLLPCDDGDFCTLDDRCADGACAPGAANPQCCAPGDDAACDDGDACTTDTCPAGLCVNAPLDCDDALACTADRCEGGSCVHAPWGPAGPETVALADFEGAGALEGWSLASNNVDVAWRLDASTPHGGGGALYCGAVPAYSYDFGATLATASRVVAIPPGQATLRFWVRLDVEENASCIYDVLRVSVDDVALAPVCASVAPYEERTYDVSAWAGSWVTLSFTFDTFDDQANAGAGAWIDDLGLSVANDLGCCAAPADCDGGAGCLAPSCDATWRCVVPAASVACDDDDACTEDACLPDGGCDHTALPNCP